MLMFLVITVSPIRLELAYASTQPLSIAMVVQRETHKHAIAQDQAARLREQGVAINLTKDIAPHISLFLYGGFSRHWKVGY